MAKSTKKAKAPKLIQEPCPLSFSRDGDDLVVRAVGLYVSEGVETKSDADTRKVAASRGMFSWLPTDKDVGDHPSTRKVGIKFVAILSKPIEASDGKSETKKDTSHMSEMSYE